MSVSGLHVGVGEDAATDNLVLVLLVDADEFILEQDFRFSLSRHCLLLLSFSPEVVGVSAVGKILEPLGWDVSGFPVTVTISVSELRLVGHKGSRGVEIPADKRSPIACEDEIILHGRRTNVRGALVDSQERVDTRQSCLVIRQIT